MSRCKETACGLVASTCLPHSRCARAAVRCSALERCAVSRYKLQQECAFPLPCPELEQFAVSLENIMLHYLGFVAPVDSN
eukprot:5825442-Amphidinium_carterae.1